MSPIIIYLYRAFLFHISIIFFQTIVSQTKLPNIGLGILEVGWTAEGLMVFYIYSSAVIVRLLRKSPGDMSMERHIYNASELYGFYIICAILGIIGRAFISVYVFYMANMLSNAVFIGHIWLQINGYSEKPFLAIIFNNKERLLVLAALIELASFTDRVVYNLYIVPVLIYGFQRYLNRYPLRLEGTPDDRYVKLLWRCILDNVG